MKLVVMDADVENNSKATKRTQNDKPKKVAGFFSRANIMTQGNVLNPNKLKH